MMKYSFDALEGHTLRYRNTCLEYALVLISLLLVATTDTLCCRNDILYRFWQSGRYEKHPTHGEEAQGGLKSDGAQAHGDGCKETLSPAMDILVSSNFERLMWFLAKGTHFAPAIGVASPLLTGDRLCLDNWVERSV